MIHRCANCSLVNSVWMRWLNVIKFFARFSEGKTEKQSCKRWKFKIIFISCQVNVKSRSIIALYTLKGRVECKKYLQTKPQKQYFKKGTSGFNLPKLQEQYKKDYSSNFQQLACQMMFAVLKSYQKISDICYRLSGYRNFTDIYHEIAKGPEQCKN